MRKLRCLPLIFIGVCLSIVVVIAQQKKGQKALVAKPKSVAEAVERVNPSIVQIKLRIEQEPAKKGDLPNYVDGKGTGFWVSEDGYVVTARHVVKPTDGKVKELFVALPIPPVDGPAVMRGIFQVTRASIVAEDAANDLVLVKTEINPFRDQMKPMMKLGNREISYQKHAIAQLDPNRPKEGTQIVVTGYPLDEPVTVTNVGYLATAWGINSDSVRTLTPSATGISNVYLADMRINHGNSGGPVYSAETGFVIGVCVAFKLAPLEAITPNGAKAGVKIDGIPLMYNSGISYVVPIEYAIKLLKRVDASHMALAKKQ